MPANAEIAQEQTLFGVLPYIKAQQQGYPRMSHITIVEGSCDLSHDRKACWTWIKHMYKASGLSPSQSS